MHTLTLLTVVLSSLAPESAPASRPGSLVRDVSIPSALSLAQATAQPAPQEPKPHLVDGMIREETQDERMSRALLEVLAGAGLGVLSGGVTVRALKITADSQGLLAIPISALLLGSSVGTTLVGLAMKGRGSFGYALLGSFIGFAIPLVVGIGVLQFVDCKGETLDKCGAIKPIAWSMILLPAVGAAVGYESSAPKTWLSSGEVSRKSPAPRRVTPVLALARQGFGATVGIAGTL